jgi:hypothetical protein
MASPSNPMFENIAIPFVQIGNRRALTATQCRRDPNLAEFVRLFPDSFEPQRNLDAMLFIEPDTSA